MYYTKDEQLNTTAIVDEIEKIVYAEVKSCGFRKHGRTLHRFVDGDISQVINFQNGCAAKGVYDVLWVNVGIRIPECMLRSFAPEDKPKKYYHEYDCNLRARLGEIDTQRESCYDLHNSAGDIAADVIRQIKCYVLPAFNALNSRSAFLENSRDYPCLRGIKRYLTPLEESMIWGRKGEMQKAEALFNQYYDRNAQEYKEHEGRNSYRYLKGHLEYLEELADQLDRRTCRSTGY